MSKFEDRVFDIEQEGGMVVMPSATSIYRVAENGVAVLVIGDRMLSVAGNGKVYIRDFDKPIARQWEKRRINEFAEHVAPALVPARKRRKAA